MLPIDFRGRPGKVHEKNATRDGKNGPKTALDSTRFRRHLWPIVFMERVNPHELHSVHRAKGRKGSESYKFYLWNRTLPFVCIQYRGT